jgi:AraC-like DNA-binding protein
MKEIVFSTDGLPADLDSQARLFAWRDFLSGVCGPLDVSRRPDQPFSQHLEGTRFDGLDVLRLRGTMDRTWWTSRGVSRSPDFFLCLNRFPMALSQLERNVELPAEAAALGSCTELGDIRWKGRNDITLVVVPQARLREMIASGEDLVARPLRDGTAALRLLGRYLDILPVAKEIKANPNLTVHIARTLTDLVAVALGAEGDAAEIARMRGLRAARLQEIVAEIRAGFADPAFLPQSLARKLGVTVRHIQRLLQETGLSFHERVLELRLQRARAMLADPRYDRLKVGEIAAASGFNEIPYFNRCFRRRFGGTPTQFRGRSTS